MRSEDRVLRGESHEPVVERKRERDLGRDQQGLDDIGELGLERADRDQQRSASEVTQTLAAMRAILKAGREPAQRDRHGRTDRVRPDVDYAGLGREQAEALRFLAEAVSGRDRDGGLVYAEDRRMLLDQALTALYPALAGNLGADLDVVRAEHDAVIDDVVALRDELVALEDAQEETTIGLREVARTKPDDDDGDEADEDEDEDEEEDGAAAGEGAAAAGAAAAGDDEGDAVSGPDGGADPATRPGLLRRLLGRRGQGEPGAGS